MSPLSGVRLDGKTTATEQQGIVGIKMEIFTKIFAETDPARSFILLCPRWILLLTSPSTLCPAVEYG